MDWLDWPMEVRLQVYKLAAWLHKLTKSDDMLSRRAQPQTVTTVTPTVSLNLSLPPSKLYRVLHVHHVPGTQMNSKTFMYCGDVGVCLFDEHNDSIQINLRAALITDCDSDEVLWGAWPTGPKQA